MERLKELEVAAEDARESLKGVLAAAAKGKRALTSEEREEAAKLTEEIEGLDATIKLEREQLEFDRTEALAVDETPAAVLHQRANGPGPGGRRYAELFGTPQTSSFKDAEEYFAAVHTSATRGFTDQRLLVPTAAMNEAVGSEGGFGVPEPLAAAWLDRGLESEVVRPRATVYPMTADTIKIPGWDDSSHAAGSVAGFSAYWKPELGTLTESTGKLRMIEMAALKLTTYTQTSNELLADGGQTFRDQLENKMGAAVSFFLDSAFLTGTGAGTPLGILNDPAVVSVAKETVPAQAADTVLLPNVLKMYARMYAGGYRNAVWLCNYNVIPQLYGMQSKVLNQAGAEWVGGSLAPFFTVGANGQMRLLNLPVIPTEKLPTLGDKGDLVLADLSQFIISLRQDVQLEASRHAGWSTDSTYYRCIVRCNGMGSWKSPLTPKTGDTLSWVVTLDAR